MVEMVSKISWEAYEHSHKPKQADWFWILGIVAMACAVAAIVLGNLLFGILIILAAMVVGISASREGRIIPYEVTTRGVRIEDVLYPYSNLETFFIDEENAHGPQLFIRSVKMFMPLLILPLPPEHVDDVESLIAARLPEERLEEPWGNKMLEFFGF